LKQGQVVHIPAVWAQSGQVVDERAALLLQQPHNVLAIGATILF